MRHWLSGILTAVLLLAASLAAPLHAHPTDPPPDSAFVLLSQGSELGVGALIQADGFVARENNPDGFALNTVRLRLRGAAYRVGFFVQTDFTRSPALLDAQLDLPVTPNATIVAGLFKAPFSRGELTSSMRLPFLERARVVNALAPSRQIGISLEADLVPERLQFIGGVFNGNGRRFGLNDNDALLYAGRLAGIVPLEDGELQIGTNATYSQDANLPLSPVAASFSGRRFLFGIDALLQWQQWLVGGELITAALDPTGQSSFYPTGYYTTVGYTFQEQHQLLLRVDAFDRDRGPEVDEQLILGYNFFWTDALKLQANYVAPFGALDDGYAGVRLQLGLR